MKCQVFFLEKYIFFQIVFVTRTPKKTTHLRRKKLEPFSRWFDVTVKIYILSPFFFPNASFVALNNLTIYQIVPVDSRKFCLHSLCDAHFEAP